jgi:hypothetical protein
VIHTTFPSYADLGASPSAAEARSHSPNAALPTYTTITTAHSWASTGDPSAAVNTTSATSA